jgi:hypothetical protein
MHYFHTRSQLHEGGILLHTSLRRQLALSTLFFTSLAENVDNFLNKGGSDEA